jgi:8-oxo-dGTP pyrophosphatase MutT (NUDIX family)
MTKVLYKGKLLSKQVCITEGSNFVIPFSIKEKAKLLWEEELKNAEGEEAILFDADIYRLENLDFLNGKLFLTLGIVPYSFQKVAKYLVSEIIKESKNYYPNGLFATTLIMTKDNQYVFGKRGKTISKNEIDMIGGVLSKDENIVKKGSDLFKAIIQELNEELNLEKKNIGEICLKGVISTSTLKVGLVFYTVLNITSRDLEKTFSNRKDNEMSGLIFVKKANLRSFLLSLGGYKITIAGKFCDEKKSAGG